MANHQQQPRTAPSHSRATATVISIPHTRLADPLPPLPPPTPHAIPRLTITTHLPYHDDPSGDDITLATLQTHLRGQLSPPGYEPMFDYLRSQGRPQNDSQMNHPQQPPHYTPHLSPSDPRAQEPYRDEPFVVTVREGGEGGEAEPPSYDELFRQHEMEMQRLVMEFDTDGSPPEQVEELVKWVVAMLLVCLTIAGMGTAFNWGRPM